MCALAHYPLKFWFFTNTAFSFCICLILDIRFAENSLNMIFKIPIKAPTRILTPRPFLASENISYLVDTVDHTL